MTMPLPSSLFMRLRFLFLLAGLAWSVVYGADLDGIKPGPNQALVIIDMQDFFATREGFESLGDNKKKLDSVYTELIKIIKKAKKNKIPIIFVEYDGQGPTNTKLLNEVKDYSQFKTVTKTSDGMLSKDNVYKKDLLKILKDWHARKLIIAGANGGACVEKSLETSLENNFDVIAYNPAIIDFNFQNFVYPYNTNSDNNYSGFDQAQKFCPNANPPCTFTQVWKEESLWVPSESPIALDQTQPKVRDKKLAQKTKKTEVTDCPPTQTTPQNKAKELQALAKEVKDLYQKQNPSSPSKTLDINAAPHK